MSEPAIERLRTAVNNMNDVEATFVTVLADEARIDEVGSTAERVAAARTEFAAAMDDPVVIALGHRSTEG
jgi:hypothetical protein